MIALGYTLCITYTAILIALTKLTFTVTKSTELGRKLLHAGAFGLLFIARAFFVDFYHFSILCGVGTIFTFVSYKFRLVKSIEREQPTAGEFFYCVSLLICSIPLCFYPELFPCLVSAFAALSIGDGAASLFGKLIPSPKIRLDKTLVGTISCSLFTFLILFLLKSVSYIQFSYLSLIALSLLAGITELIGKGLDNFTVPLSVFLFSILIMYCGQDIEIALLVSESVFLIAFFSKFITYYGSLLAALIGGIFYFFDSHTIFPFAFSYLILCYGLMLLVSLIRKLLKAKEVKTVEKTKGKDGVEIFVNGFFPTLSMILYAATGLGGFLASSLVTLSAAFVDSFSSDIGTLSKKPPRDILTGKPLEKGLSGGVSWLGTITAIISSIFFALIIFLFTNANFFLCALFIFSGTLIDSVLGSCLQAKYRCEFCGIKTERKVCCNQPTKLEKGVAFFNNDIINLLSLGVVFALSLFLLLI